MSYIRLYRDAGAAGSGGPTPGPSLADLDDPNFKDPNQPPAGDPPAGDPPPGDPPADEPTEGLDADGNLLEGYELAEDGVTIRKVEAKDDHQTEEEVTPESFWKDVEKITGIEIPVDYGDVDPLSPEGVAIREQAVRAHTVDDFENHLRKSNPRAYAYFLHTQNGGSDEEFFDTPAPAIPTRDEFEQDPDVQAYWLKNDLMRKGVDEDIAEQTVDKYVKNNELKNRALKLYDQQMELDRQRLEKMEKAAEDRERQWKEGVDNMTRTLSSTIEQGMGLLVPEAKRQEFHKYVLDRIQHDGQKFVVVQELDDMAKVLDQMYVGFTNNNLKDLVERKARTLTVQRLGQRVAKDKAASSGGSVPGTARKNVTLGEI